MSLILVKNLNYHGNSGLAYLQKMQSELQLASDSGDWLKLQRLDKTCIALVDKFIAANSDNPALLIRVISELKGIYVGLIHHCNEKVATKAL